MTAGLEADHPRAASRSTSPRDPEGPRIAVRLGPSPHGPVEFSPLAPPRETSVELAGLGAGLVDRASFEGELELTPGAHALPLFPDASVRIDTRAGTKARVTLEAAARANGLVRETVVSSVEIRFETPIVIHGIVPVLAELPGLFQDRTIERVLTWVARASEARAQGAQLSALRDSLEAWVRDHQDDPRVRALKKTPGLAKLGARLLQRADELPELADRVRERATSVLSRGPRALRQLLDTGTAALRAGGDLLREALANTPETPVRGLLGPGGAELLKLREALHTHASALAEVHLERIVALPRLSGRTWILEPRFTGRFVLLDRVPVEFRNVQLPHAVIPALHAELSELVSESPLATATLRTERLRVEALADAVLTLTRSARGAVTAEGRAPALALEVLLPDQSWLAVTTSLSSPVRADAAFSATFTRHEAHVRVERAGLELDGHRLGITAEAHLDVEGGDGDRDLAERGEARRAVHPEGARDLAERSEARRAAHPEGTSGMGLGGRVVTGLKPTGASGPRGADPTRREPEVRRVDSLWREHGVRARLSAKLEEGSRVAAIGASATVRHERLEGGLDVSATVRDVTLGGHATFAVDPVPAPSPASSFVPARHGEPKFEGDLTFSGAAVLHEGSRFSDGFVTLDPAGTTFQTAGRVRAAPGLPPSLEVSSEGDVHAHLAVPVSAFPELEVDPGVLTATLPAHVRLDGAARVRDQAGRLTEVDFTGTRATIDLGRTGHEGRAIGAGTRSGNGAGAAIGVVLGERSVSVPPGSLSVQLRDAAIASSGLGRATFDVGWDFFGASPVLSHRGESIPLLAKELRRGALSVELSAVGGLSIVERGTSEAPVEIMDGPLMTALLRPGANPDRLFELLEDEEVMGPALKTVRVFSPEAHRALLQLRDFAVRVRRSLDAEGVRQPADAIPGPKLARILSRFLTDTPDLADRLHPIVKQVTDGRGLDVHTVKRLLDEVLGDHDYEFEVDRTVRWVKHLLAPTEPIPPQEPKVALPIAWAPEYAVLRNTVPSARDIYQTVDAERPLPVGFSRSLARYAPYLTLEQIEYLVGHPRRDRGKDWHEGDLVRMLHVRELKRRVRMLEEHYGGIAHAPQALAIAFFLGETIALSDQAAAISRSEGRPTRPTVGKLLAKLDGVEAAFTPANTLIGPADAAALIQAGLAAVLRGRTVQLNLAMLLEHVLSQPASYLLGVLSELSRANARVLAGALNALLNLDQRCVRRPLDLPAEVSERLGIEVPRLADYQAGGRFASQSYFEALNRTADEILRRAEPYVALKLHLQLDRSPPSQVAAVSSPITLLTPDAQEREGRARAAIAAADVVGALCRFEPGQMVLEEHERARAAYREAFRAVADVLAADDEAFQRPWLKEFWARNHEALMVLGVVRNYEDDVDTVRRWLGTRLGRALPVAKGEAEAQEILLGVLDAMYYDRDDRARLAADPLVRLLIDPPIGKYDFTIVTAMGVITDGARGVELEESFARLSKKRGVSVIRADTANFRSLEFNATRIEEAIRRVKTPWGYIGYSQGCANLFQAESMLLTGTPEQQALLGGLVARNLLYSAFNGSAHGTASDLKFLRAMTEGERFLKHYQSLLSKRAIEASTRSLRLFLDSKPFVAGLLGGQSLSPGGLASLHREGRWKSNVPTSIIRGIVEPETLPEALEWLSNVLTVEIESDAHDTQVVASDAVGHPVATENPAADVLRRSDMGCLVQRTHHWSPLVKEVEFITTERDRAHAIYDFPKDRHVFPWIEVNARFGRIRLLQTGEAR